MNGRKQIIKTDIIYPGDLNEDKDILADMITIAMNNALTKIEKEIEKKLGAYSKQLGGLM